MTSYARDIILTIFIALILGGLVAFGITAGIIASNHNNQKNREVQTACIQAGKQWISGNCIAVP